MIDVNITILNDYTEDTKGTIHLLTTSLCDRDCKYCCNKQYDLNDIPYVTKEELSNCHTIYITGGEPFLFSQPNNIALYLRKKYPNIKNVGVYGNANALREYLLNGGDLNFITHLSISIKNIQDYNSLSYIITNPKVMSRYKQNNRLYLMYFLQELPNKTSEIFTIINREWQEKFIPDSDSIFRKL